jgi:hypothetical protein
MHAVNIFYLTAIGWTVLGVEEADDRIWYRVAHHERHSGQYRIPFDYDYHQAGKPIRDLTAERS